MHKLEIFPVPELEILDENYITVATELSSEALTNDKDRIQLENLLKEAEEKLNLLEEEGDKSAFKERLEEARTNIRELISHRGGLAIYMTKDDIYYYHLDEPTQTLVDVGFLPNFKPLIESFAFTSNFHVLVLSREEMSLFRANRYGVEPVKFEDEDAPVDLKTALGDELDGGELNHGTYGSRGGSQPQTFHGHNDTSSEKDIDRENYFRAVDNYIYENYSLPTEKPILLYALTENQSVFRDISKNQFLMEESIAESGNKLSTQEIANKVKAAYQEILAHEQNNKLAELNETKPEFRITNQPNDLAQAALQGRINELFIRQGYKLDGEINERGLYEESGQNFLKQIVARVVQAKGKVYLYDGSALPEGADIIARLRY